MTKLSVIGRISIPRGKYQEMKNLPTILKDRIRRAYQRLRTEYPEDKRKIKVFLSGSFSRNFRIVAELEEGFWPDDRWLSEVIVAVLNRESLNHDFDWEVIVLKGRKTIEKIDGRLFKELHRFVDFELKISGSPESQLFGE
jgi:hypothetical protein